MRLMSRLESLHVGLFDFSRTFIPSTNMITKQWIPIPASAASKSCFSLTSNWCVCERERQETIVVVLTKMITIETSSSTENASLEMHELIDGAIHLLGAGQHVVDTESGDIALILDSAVEGIVTLILILVGAPRDGLCDARSAYLARSVSATDTLIRCLCSGVVVARVVVAEVEIVAVLCGETE